MSAAPLPALATIADVQARTEAQLTAEQQARAAVLIGDASAIIRARVPDLSDPPPATAPGVIAMAVLRALVSRRTATSPRRWAGTRARPRTRAAGST